MATLSVTVRTSAGQPSPMPSSSRFRTIRRRMAGAKPRAEQLEQIDKEFVPKVKPVFVGSTVAFPNKDSVRHHVYSFSPAKRFELPLYAGVPSQPVLFDKAGVVVLGCNIHDWMIGYIYVSESPWFAKTGADGRAQITDLPPRDYSLRVWHAQQEGTEDDTRRPLELSRRTARRSRLHACAQARSAGAPRADRRPPRALLRPISRRPMRTIRSARAARA